MSTIPNTYAEAQAKGISYKAWLHMCEQEDIQREEDERCWPACCQAGEDPRDEAEAVFDRACERAPLPYSESLSCSDDEGIIYDDSLGGYGEMAGSDDDEQDFFTALADPNSREIFPGEDPDSICMCPACSTMRAKFDHDVALARAVLHCPEPAPQSDPDWCYYCDRPRHDCACHLDPNGPPEETGLVNAALNTPLARWIQGQLAMERWAS